MAEGEHQICQHCGERGINFDWVKVEGKEDRIPIWKCKCGAKWKDTRWKKK